MPDDNKGNIFSSESGNDGNIISFDGGSLPVEKRNIFHRDKGLKRDPLATLFGRGIFENPYQMIPIFYFDASVFPSKDLVSGNLFSQVYTDPKRTYIGADGLLHTAAINTIVIDYVNGPPMLRIEGVAANILLEVITDWTKSGGTTVTKDATSWLGAANGAWTIVAGGADATVISMAIAGTSAAFTFVCAIKRKTGTGAVSMTVDNGATWAEKTLTTSFQYFNVTKTAANPQLGFKLATSGDEIIVDCLMLVPNTAIPSSYFDGAAAIGAELVTDGGFAAVVDNVGELSSGIFTVGNCYKISAHTDTDFTTVGAPDSNVGTYFNATATGGAGILDAGDKVYPVTFQYWTCGDGWAPMATAGALVNKAQKIVSSASYLQQNIPAMTVNKSLRLSLDVTYGTSGFAVFTGSGTVQTSIMSATGTYYKYTNTVGAYNTMLSIQGHGSGSIDNVSVRECGTIRLSEAKTITITTPDKLLTSLADVGTLAIKFRTSYEKNQVAAATNILTFANSATEFLYHTNAGLLTLRDGTNTATINAYFYPNISFIEASRWGKTGAKMDTGTSLSGAMSFGTEATFDGAMTTTGGLTYLFHTIGQGGVWIEWIKTWDTIKSETYLNSLGVI